MNFSIRSSCYFGDVRRHHINQYHFQPRALLYRENIFLVGHSRLCWFEIQTMFLTWFPRFFLLRFAIIFKNSFLVSREKSGEDFRANSADPDDEQWICWLSCISFLSPHIVESSAIFSIKWEIDWESWSWSTEWNVILRTSRKSKFMAPILHTVLRSKFTLESTPTHTLTSRYDSTKFWLRISNWCPEWHMARGKLRLKINILKENQKWVKTFTTCLLSSSTNFASALALLSLHSRDANEEDIYTKYCKR